MPSVHLKLNTVRMAALVLILNTSLLTLLAFNLKGSLIKLQNVTLFPNPLKHIYNHLHPPSICLSFAKIQLLAADTRVVSSFFATAFESLN
jgi:hypothetical protein